MDYSNYNMKNTLITFDLIKIGNDYIVDPNSLYVSGYFNWYMLNDFLFESKDSCLSDIAEELKITELSTEVTLEMWVDNDEFRSWIDYNIIHQIS